MIAGIPVAAWTASPLAPNIPMNQIARNHVPTPAISPSPPPAATGLRYARLPPRKLAVIAASTRIVSRPSRKTRIALSTTAVVGLM